MNHKAYFRISLISTILVVVTATLLFSIVSLKLGDGFGREINLIIDQTSSSEDFDTYVKELQRSQVEVYRYELEDDLTMIKLIGINDVQTFIDHFTRELPMVPILEVGTFGALSTISNSIKLFQIYFIVFIFAFIAYSIYRKQMTGLLTSLSSAFMLITSLFIMNFFGFLLNNVMWYGLLLAFAILVIHKKGLTLKLSDVLEENYNNVNKTIYESLNISINFSVGFLFFGAVLLMFAPQFTNIAVLFIMLSVYILIERFMLLHYLPKVIPAIKEEPRLKSIFMRRDSLFSPSDFLNQWMSKIMLFLTIAVLAMSSVSLLFQDLSTFNSPKLAKQHYITVPRNDPQSFLEVQATLRKYDLHDHLIEYRVSEEKSTWFKFDGLIEHNLIKLASADINNKIGLATHVFVEEDISSFSTSILFYIGMVAAFAASFVLVWFNAGKNEGIVFLAYTFLSILLMSTFAYFMEITYSKIFLLTLYFYPFLVANLFMVDKFSQQFKLGLNYIMRFLKQAGGVFAIIVLPIIVIIPKPNVETYAMIKMLMSIVLSFVSSSLIIYYLGVLKRRNL